MATVSLHIIAKKNEEDLKRLISNYASFVDEVDIAVDQDIDIDFKEFAGGNRVNVYKYDWSEKEIKRGYPNFDDKRNFLVSKCKSEYYLRVDTDDVLPKPELIRDIVVKMVRTNIDVIACFYNYSRDEDGNCRAGHYRETFVANNGKYRWNKPIHENIIPIEGGKPNAAIDKEFSLIHEIDVSHFEESRDRNLKFLLEEYEETKDNPDPRTLAYLGRMLYPMGYLKDAKYFLEKHIKMSGWDEDRYMSWTMLADVYNDLGDWDTAIGCCHEALHERHDFPEAYLKLHELYYQKEQWVKAIHWGKIGMSIKRPDSFTLIDPSAYTWRPSLSMAYCYLMTNDPDTAYKFFKVVHDACPTLGFIKENKKTFEDAVIYKKYLENFLWNLQLLRERDTKKIQSLFDTIPEELKNHEVLLRLKHQHLPSKKWGDNEIAIFCGQAWEDWAAPSILKGIGGSEEAVVYLSQELAAKGYKVTVFNSCGDLEGTYANVTYKPYHAFNPYDDYSILIAWRLSIFGNKMLKAKRKIVWLHDVPIEGMFPKQEVDTYDKIVVLSKFHKSLLPDYIPEDKIFVSRNGINQRDFEPKEQFERNPKRIIYTSSYDRGIEHLLQEWGNIRKEVPDAELHLFYGWDTYLKMMKQGRRPKEFYDHMCSLMKLDGVYEHGRIGHKQLVKEFFKSAIFAYPSHFEEISCISAMKAQACGCIPLVTNYAALKETVVAGIKIEGKAGDGDTNYRFRDELVSILKDKERQKELRLEVWKHRKEFSWKDVADKWVEELFKCQ